MKTAEPQFTIAELMQAVAALQDRYNTGEKAIRHYCMEISSGLEKDIGWLEMEVRGREHTHTQLVRAYAAIRVLNRFVKAID